MKDKWFRWEREASVHLLFPTFEAFFNPLFEYSGVSAPTMVLVFKRGVVTWCIKEDEFTDYGRKLLKIYSHSQKEKKMVGDISKARNHLKLIEARQEKLNLQELADKDLVKEHSELYGAFLDYYLMGAIGTPLSFAAEIDLKAKGLADEELNILTTPEKISYVAEADNYLLSTRDIKRFAKKYFWINNNYSSTTLIGEAEVRKRLKLLLSKKTVPSKPQKINLKVKLNKTDKRYIELLKHYSVYKDNRKKEILIYLHYIDRILKEISRRTNLSIDETRASCPSEVGDILSGKLAKGEMDKRLNYFVIVWEKGKKSAEILGSKKGEKWEQKTLTKVENLKIIKGTTASLGKVQGRVRILFKAGNSEKLKVGEVLVTFMTSPDFMPAIRKCCAIVTNLGGVTCHAAIISRELKIPCIVGTKIATKVLKDGDLVEVDANQGIIKVL